MDPTAPLIANAAVACDAQPAPPALEMDLQAAEQLHRISTELIREDRVESLYEKIMDAAVAIMHSDFASMQMFYPERGARGELRLLAFCGFTSEAAQFWEWVTPDITCTCGLAFRRQERVIVTSVEQCDSIDADQVATYLGTGIRAVQSTPLFSRSGALVGMISTHWREAHDPSPGRLRMLDMLARQAADLIERTRAQEAAQQANRDLESRVEQRTVSLAAAQQRLAHSEQALRQLSHFLLRSQDDERRRIGAELHDSVGQLLAMVKMNLDVSTALLTPSQVRVRLHLTESRSLIEDAIKHIRSLSHLLYPPLLEEMGLTSAIRWYLDGFQARSGISVDLSVDNNFSRLPRETELALFRVLQECLTNILRHSGSERAALKLFSEGSKIVLEVSDSGHGFSEVPPEAVNASGVGLRSMFERMQQIGGSLEIASSEKGTTVRAVIPHSLPPTVSVSA